MSNYKNRKAKRGGFTLVEVVVAMAMSLILITQAFGVVSSVLKVNRAVMRDNIVESNMRNMVYNVSQILKTASVSFVVGPDKFDGTSDADGKTRKLTKGWNYIGVSADKREFCIFRFMPTYADENGKKVLKSYYHQKQVLAYAGASNSADVTYDFHVTGNSKERLLNFVLTQNIKWEKENLVKQLDTSVFAMNSRNVNGAEGICVAFRNDPIEVDRAAGEARFMLCLDVSGSMLRGMHSNGGSGHNSDTGYARERMRIGVLERALEFLVDNLAKNELITLGMTSFAYNTEVVYYPNIASGLGPKEPTPDNPDTAKDDMADERYFTSVAKSKDDLLSQYIKVGQAKHVYSNGKRDLLFCNGATNTGDSIRTGMAMLRKADDSSRKKINHLILLTDGEPNGKNFTFDGPISYDQKWGSLFNKFPQVRTNMQKLNKFWIIEDFRTNYGAEKRIANRDYMKPYEGDIVGGAGIYYNKFFPSYEEARDADMNFFTASTHYLNKYGHSCYITYADHPYIRGTLTEKLKNARNAQEYYNLISPYININHNYVSLYKFRLPIAFHLDDFGQRIVKGGNTNYFTVGDWLGSTFNAKAVDWCADVFLNKNKNKGKEVVKKFHMIGFGSKSDVEEKCKQVVDRINASEPNRAYYYFGGNTEDLKKIFEDIIKEINNDLWFIEGPRELSAGTPTP